MFAHDAFLRFGEPFLPPWGTTTGKIANLNPTRYFSYAVWLHPDGFRIFLAGNGSLSVLRMSTQWDITTATLETRASYDTSIFPLPAWMWMSQDGKKIVIASYTKQPTYQIKLSTAWDVTTAESDGSIDFGMSSSKYISDDGTVMLMISSAAGQSTLHKYHLSTPGNVTTATSVQSFSLPITGGALTCSPDGRRIYIVNGSWERVVQFFTNTPWDVEGVVEMSSSKMFLGAETPRSIHFRPDGQALYRFLAGGSTIDTLAIPRLEQYDTPPWPA